MWICNVYTLKSKYENFTHLIILQFFILIIKNITLIGLTYSCQQHHISIDIVSKNIR